MKKLFFITSIILLVLGFTSCSKDEIKPDDPQGTAIIFDGDPGTDDATTLMLLKQNNLSPDWMVATFGNMTIDKVLLNSHILNKAYGINAVVAKGASTPYDGHEVTCGDFHGSDALAEQADSLAKVYGVNDEMVASSKTLADLADYICSKESVTYIAVGPLASLSHLITEFPETQKHIGRVLIMGGGIDHFNKDGDKEYNFAGDGIAVKNVWDSSLDLTIMPLDITYFNARLSMDEIESLQYNAYPWMKHIFLTNHRSNVKTKQTTDQAVLHDCLTALYLLQPGQFQMEEMKLIANDKGHIERNASGRKVNVGKSTTDKLLYNAVSKALR